MTFRILPESLREVARQTTAYFENDRGLRRIKFEEELLPSLQRPTVHGLTAEQEYVWIEFSENGCYGDGIGRVIEDVRAEGLACKVYVAVPSGTGGAGFEGDLIRARRQGLGVLVVEVGRVNVMSEALSQIHTLVRPLRPTEFPRRLRGVVQEAHQMYASGNPAEACKKIYEEIEPFSRTVAEQAYQGSLLGAATTGLNWKTASWHNVLDYVARNGSFPLKSLDQQIWVRVASVREFRNQVAHKPRNPSQRKARDLELRTRFESALDILRDFVKSSKGFRL